jgi:hypothetical protein
VQNIQQPQYHGHKKSFVQNSFFETYHFMMEGQIEGNRGDSLSANSSWLSADGSRPPPQRVRVVSTSQADIHIDPWGDTSHTSSLRTNTQHIDGVHKVKKQKPGEFDILCGRGRSFQDHSGNRVLRQLVKLHSDTYRKAKRSHKALTPSNIVAAFNDSGNQFLKCDDKDEFWEAIDHEVAKEKVSHCFRSSPRVRDNFL